MAQPVPGFGQGLRLAMTLDHQLAEGDKAVVAAFVLTNQGAKAFDGCFGEEWGVNIILEDGRSVGHLSVVDHPSCIKPFGLAPGQTIEWSETLELENLRAGKAKVNGWLKVVDPTACDRKYGCYDATVSSQMTTVTVAGK